MRSVLSRHFTSYLRAGTPSAQDALVEALAGAGFTIEASMLSEWTAGQRACVLQGPPWAGARVEIGATPPATPKPGELWFDICELTLMVFVDRSWLATRPVARWQMAGCLAAAQWTSREVQVRPPYRALDPARLLAGDERSACTDVTPGEATLYAWWFGKHKPSIYDWRSAESCVPAIVMSALWRASAKEWISGAITGDEAAHAFVTQGTMDWEPDDLAELERDLPPSERRMIRGEFTREPDIGFRTAISAQTGLYQRVTAWHILVEDVRFLSLLDRSRFRAVRRLDEPLTELFAYTFRSEVGIRQMHARLTDLGTWKWHERDNDRWGEYISASPLPTARRAQIKILDVPDAPDRFAVNVHLESDDADARAQFDEVRRVLFQDVLPAIGAHDLLETDTYE